MKKINIMLITWITGFLIVAGFIFLCLNYREPTIEMVYSAQITQYQNLLSTYNDKIAENNSKTEQYNADMEAYNKAIESDTKKEEVPEDGIITIAVDYSIYNEENKVGDKWSYVVKINGNLLDSSSTEISVNSHDPLTIYIRATEEDDANSDTGTAEKIIHYTNEEIIDGLSDQINVNVREDAGRYTGNTANITVSFKIKRVIDQVVIPLRPDEPTLVSTQEPVKPVMSDIKINFLDVAKYNNIIKVYAVLILVFFAAIVLFIKKEKILSRFRK